MTYNQTCTGTDTARIGLARRRPQGASLASKPLALECVEHTLANMSGVCSNTEIEPAQLGIAQSGYNEAVHDIHMDRRAPPATRSRCQTMMGLKVRPPTDDGSYSTFALLAILHSNL